MALAQGPQPPQRPQEQGVEEDPQDPDQDPEHHKEGQGGQGGQAQWRQGQGRPLSQEAVADHHRQAARQDDRLQRGEAVFEVLPQFLGDEDDGRQRGIEGGGESRRRAGRDQGAALPGIQAQPLGRQLAQGGAHVDRRPLAPQHQAGADRQDPGDELDRQHPLPAQAVLTGEDGLHLLNAAAGGLRGEAAHQPQGDAQHQGSQGHQHQPTRHRGRLQGGAQQVAALIGLVEQGMEGRPDQPRQGAHQGRGQKRPHLGHKLRAQGWQVARGRSLTR